MTSLFSNYSELFKLIIHISYLLNVIEQLPVYTFFMSFLIITMDTIKYPILF